jgi:hypothetical protein
MRNRRCALLQAALEAGDRERVSRHLRRDYAWGLQQVGGVLRFDSKTRRCKMRAVTEQISALRIGAVRCR